jgi:hypothetical protein
MTTKNIKIALFSALTIAVIIAAPNAIVAQEGEVPKLTRDISEEEFREAQIKVLDLRSEQNKLVRQSDDGVDITQQIAELDTQINELMPILDKHQEQNFAKYYIEPVRKAQLEKAELELRESVSKLDFDSYSVNLNHLTKTIEVVTNDPTKNSQVTDLFASYAADIPIELTYGEFKDVPFACADQSDDCDPIVGGIEIRGEGDGICTLGLPVRDGSWPFYSYHFATAGHCIDDNDDMGQPEDTSADKIADSTDSEEVGDCDCALSDKIAGNAPGSDVWRSSNNYLTVTTESSSRPANGYDLTFSGRTSGFVFGEVVDGTYTVTINGKNWDGIRHDMSLDFGDSGGPFGDADFSEIVGIEYGELNGVPFMSAWEEFDKDYSVSLY